MNNFLACAISQKIERLLTCRANSTSANGFSVPLNIVSSDNQAVDLTISGVSGKFSLASNTNSYPTFNYDINMPFRTVKLTGDAGNLNITAISLISPVGLNTATSLSVSLQDYPNLTTFSSLNNGLQKISGYGNLTKLTSLVCKNTSLTQTSLESFSKNTELTTLEISSIFAARSNSALAGIFPSFSNNTKLVSLTITGTSLTSSGLSFAANTALTDLNLQDNLLGGAFPTLPTSIQSFDFSNNLFTGTIPSFSNLVDLTNVYIQSNPNLTGSIPSLTLNTKLVSFHGHYNYNVSGTIPSLSTNTSLQTFNVTDCRGINSFAGGTIPASLTAFRAIRCSLTAAAVNSILAAFVAAGRTGSFNLLLSGGTNAAPTGQGITDKATLVSRGWVVATN